MSFISIGLSSQGRYDFPDGDPVSEELLSDGRTKYILKDGRAITCPQRACYTLHYISSFVGVTPGETYEVPISLVGHSPTLDEFFEAWDYGAKKLKCYKYEKTASLVHNITGESFSGVELRKELTERR